MDKSAGTIANYTGSAQTELRQTVQLRWLPSEKWKSITHQVRGTGSHCLVCESQIATLWRGWGDNHPLCAKFLCKSHLKNQWNLLYWACPICPCANQWTLYIRNSMSYNYLYCRKHLPPSLFFPTRGSAKKHFLGTFHFIPFSIFIKCLTFISSRRKKILLERCWTIQDMW